MEEKCKLVKSFNINIDMHWESGFAGTVCSIEESSGVFKAQKSTSPKGDLWTCTLHG